MTQAIQDILLLRRQIKINAQIPLDTAKNNLTTALSQDITLSGKFQLTRHYSGHLRDNDLYFYGPRANRQFCFQTKSELIAENNTTTLIAKINLTNSDFYQLLSAVILLLIALAVMLRWGFIFVLPIFVTFLYGMAQWHFQFYTKEITQLLTDIVLGKELNSKPEEQL
ncbi:MAG: hypothetical protein WBB82_14960 [Limnothrix sp.]